MYSAVSAAFNTANAKGTQKHAIRGTIGAVSFNGDNVLNMTITKKNSDGTDINLGAAFIGELNATFLKNTGILPRGWVGKDITVEFGLCISENPDVYEWIPMGIYTIADASISLEGTTVTAYDRMSRFDKYLPDDWVAAGSLYQIISFICNKCDVSFGMRESECEALPNGTEPLGEYPTNDCTTYRDLLYWLAQLSGCFCDITRDGKLVLKQYPLTIVPDITMNNDTVVSDAQFSSWVTDFGSCIFTNEDEKKEVYGSAAVGVTYECGMNPFLIYGSHAKREQMRLAVLNTLTHIKYQPFNVGIMSAPVFDLGDIIYFSGDIAGSESYVGFVNYVEFSAGQGTIIQGFGSNPNQQNTKQDSDKAVISAKSSASDKETVYARYTNQSEYTIGSTPVTVVTIPFGANKPTDVEIWHEFQLETNPDEGEKLEIEATYYLDMVEIERKPVETWDDAAKHLLDLHYMTRIQDAGTHEWSVALTATNGTAVIRQTGALAVLKGQGLAKESAWNGVIILDDDVPALSIIAQMFTLSEICSVKARDLDHLIQLADNITGFSCVVPFCGLTEQVGIKWGYGDWVNFCGENYYCGTEGVLL